MRLAALLLILLPCFAYGQTKEQLPTGKQYLVGVCAHATEKVADLLDEIATLKRERDALQAMLMKREEPKK